MAGHFAVNYRHAFHAGNFADVVKHAVLALLIERLKQKETAFRVIDTHAGRGIYDLGGNEAGRTGEWHSGIGRLNGRALDGSLKELLSPYLSAVTVLNGATTPAYYPGSPAIVRHLLRRQDRLTAVELHPEDADALAHRFAGDRQVRTIHLDGYLALGSFVPPKERRGLVLVDPPFEELDEFDRMLDGLANAHRRWPAGLYLLWYPVKDLVAIDRFRFGLARNGIARLLRAELTIRARTGGTFNGTGLVICNPPWQFEKTLEDLLRRLVPILADGPGADYAIDRISGE